MTLNTHSKAKAGFFLTAVLAFPFAHSETFQGIGPYLTLGEIKAKFPNAAVTPIKAAWVTEKDGFYSISGPGFPGLLYVAFSDNRSVYAKLYRESDILSEGAETWKVLSEQPTDTALVTSWMRWIPAAPIPLQRYFLKYGKQEKVKFSEDDMHPYYLWADKGIQVNITDDEKMVVSVEFTFTKQENMVACLKKYPKSTCDIFHK